MHKRGRAHRFLVIALLAAVGVCLVAAVGSFASSAAAPKISSFSPLKGKVGTKVTIVGLNLKGAKAVKFNGTKAVFTVVSSSKITTSVPVGARSGKISVTTPAGTATSTASFTVIPAPKVSSFTPTTGPVGTQVTITGSNFTGATVVKFHGIAASLFAVKSATSIQAKVPAGATSGSVSVTTPGGTATSSGTFTVTHSPAPTISSFTPTSGPVGTPVTIAGGNLTGATAVKFHGIATSSFTVQSASSIKATVPAGATSGTVSVTTPGGTATSSGTFTVTPSPAPTINSFTPTSGPVGTAVTITGANFTGATAVKFHGIGTTSYTVQSASSIQATVPPGATSGTISVTTPGGTATSGGSFSVSVTPTADECGTLNANTIWTPANSTVYVLTCTVIVPKGVTLTLQPGTVVKSGGPTIDVQGSLVATGTAASPVTFTSWRDDTVGGDTNGDGNATFPARGDWGGIVASPAGNGNPNPTLDLNHVVVKYAQTAISANQATTSIRNSTVDHVAGDGIDVSSPQGVPTVSGNTVTSASNVAISISGASLDMGALDGNSGSGNGLNGVQLGGDTVTVSSSLPWSGSLIPVLYGGCNGLTVAPTVTLTLGAGTIVKGEPNGCSYLSVQGSLVATGTAASPVTFTSWRDDTVGGDTNGDGNATFPARGDWGGIVASPAGNGNPNPTLDLNHVVVKYAQTAISANQATTSIRNSTVGHVAGDGIDVSSPQGVPTVSGNTVTSASNVAISISGASLDMGALDGNSGSGNGLNGVQLGNDTVTVNSSLPWTGTLIPVLYNGCNGLTVAPGVTLTLGAGTVIKGNANCLSVQGTLVANGTAASPVTLTSWRDDTVGGDTNGDGSATAPAAGDWGGLYASPAGNGNPNPTLDLNHVVVKYASTAISASQATTSIRNSLIDHVAADGIYVASPQGVPTVSGNTVTSESNPNGAAIIILGASLDMGALDGNSGSGNGLNGVQLDSDTVTVSSSLPWTGTLIPVLYNGCNGLTVAPGVTLTLGAGTIIKGNGSCAYLSVQGTLDANGTSASPVTLTSWRDDTVGGDTNGDGSATSPAAGDWGGLIASPAGNGNPDPVLNLNHVDVRYAASGISSSQTSTSITNSSVTHDAGDGIQVSNPDGIPVVSGNTVTSASNVAISIQSASLDLGALDGNSGSGNGLNGVQLGGDTVTVNSSLPWSGSLIPVLYSGCNALTVAPTVTLTLGAGTIIKGEGGCAYLSVQGTLVANGTPSSPVALTSWRNNSVGGSTTGIVSPSPGDWGGIVVASGGTATLEATRLTYASTALQVADNAQVSMSGGAILNSSLGISAGDQYVAATNVDWGDSSGPAPIGTGTPINGNNIVVTPWVGFVPPPTPPQTPPPSAPSDTNCADILFIGLRGTGEDPQGSQAIADAYSNGVVGNTELLGSRVEDVYQAMTARLSVLGYTGTPRIIGVPYPAFPLPSGISFPDFIVAVEDPFEFLPSVWQGAYDVEFLLQQETQRCQNVHPERIVLVGYSQGALSIHLALNDLAQEGLLGSIPIAAVELISDPARRGDGQDLRLGDAPFDSQGVYDSLGQEGIVQVAGSIPSSLNGRTTEICHVNDIVCDFADRNSGLLGGYVDNVHVSFGQHTNYSSDELAPLGTIAANQVYADIPH